MNRNEYPDYSFTRLPSGDWGVLAREARGQKSQTGDVVEVTKANGDTSEARLGNRTQDPVENYGVDLCWVKYEVESH